jgi:hypothetical protein
MRPHPNAPEPRVVNAQEVKTMNARSLDPRLCGCSAHGGSEARQVALEFHRQAFIRRTLNPDDALRRRVLAFDAVSAAILADCDAPGVDYAAGAGY